MPEACFRNGTTETLLKTTVCEHSLSLHPQMHSETLPCKEVAINRHDPETRLPSLGPSPFKMYCGEEENCPVG